jgi:hypothetical protein
MGSGLLVTELLGQGVNYVTGDYSRGAAGYWVEKGEIAYPVEEITIAGNLREMLRGIVAIGNDIEVRGSKQVGSILSSISNCCPDMSRRAAAALSGRPGFDMVVQTVASTTPCSVVLSLVSVGSSTCIPSRLSPIGNVL